ncbi:hypothetical protein [Prevotella sp. KH2C16]|uniref:hypothetical protein n=1 Tax=Prevotella sp. KH2C16 TaxID=1855325 RepID=UPI0008E9FAC5|nr:hypothetical protein [Prevotella sp. KH2C16]SFF98351.1 hypothetical protein SAMN05216383_103102 [Prevotella sp. KH2C16]
MKKGVTILMLLVFTLSLSAQQRSRHHFDPKKFEAEMEQYITRQAALTPVEASKFFPLYREMQKKQRVYFQEMRRCRHIDANDVEACSKAVKRMDEIDIQMKMIQQEYHLKFMNVIPANKVLEIIKAENRFHRQAFKKAAGRPASPQGN